MSDLQLGLFGDAPVVHPRSERRAVAGDLEPTPPAIGPTGAGAPCTAGHPDSEPASAAEPYAFTIADPHGRWTISAGHEDEVKRGKRTRRMVGRCSCGWMSDFHLHPCGSTGPDLLVAHLRAHQLESRPPEWVVEEERGGWSKVRLLAGRVHCASTGCHRLGPLPGQRRPPADQEHRLSLGFGQPCQLHGGVVFDRPYHWEEQDPQDHSGEPRRSHAVGLLDPEGVFWHLWCAPIEGRRLFGFVRQDERSGATNMESESAAPVS